MVGKTASNFQDFELKDVPLLDRMKANFADLRVKKSKAILLIVGFIGMFGLIFIGYLDYQNKLTAMFVDGVIFAAEFTAGEAMTTFLLWVFCGGGTAGVFALFAVLT